MRIFPSDISASGPGVDLSNLPEDLSIKMSDPVKDFEYARNAVTLTFDLSAYEHVLLACEAMEFGDEPHAPPPSPFSGDVNFDGVAVSADGQDWYEVQDLRHLRSDRFTRYEVDLDAAIAQWGLSKGSEFRVRFCQYDNNPAPMDGIFLHKIELTGDLIPPVLHLPMDDNAANPVVHDAAGSHDQTFSDPGGDPNTNAHSTAGAVGLALTFDGVDDCLVLTPESHKPYLAENCDFAIAFWWKSGAPDPALTLHVLSNYAHLAGKSCFFFFTNGGKVHVWVYEYWPEGNRLVRTSWENGTDGNWHHYAMVRKGTTISFYQDGVLKIADTDIHNAVGLAPDSRNVTLGKSGDGDQRSPGSFDDFRIYDRAMTAEEIVSLI